MFVLYVASITWLAGISQTMTHFPRNAAAVVGQTVTFNCRTGSHNSVWWKHKAVGSKTERFLFNSKDLAGYDCDSCTVNNTQPGQYDLHITNTKLSNAGTYFCVETNEISTNANASRADKHVAELVALASLPQCGSNLTGSKASLLEDNDFVWMWCKVNYRGNIAPLMKWRNKANDEIIPSRITNYQNRQVESAIIIQLKHDDNRGIVYSCTTYFNQSFFPFHGSIDSVAKNAPDYTYTWTSQGETGDYTSLSTKKPSTETAKPSSDSQALAITMITPVVILLMILIFFIILSKLSRKGCFKKVSSAGPNIISLANTGDHVYSLEPVQTSFRQQHGILQNEVPSVTTGALTHAMINVGGGGHGPQEEIEVDILRSINNPEERRRAAAVNDDVHMQRPTFNDGTVYMQVNTGRGGTGGGGGSHVSPRIQQTTPIQSLFSTSTYAAIDHTTRVLPLPPATRRQ